MHHHSLNVHAEVSVEYKMYPPLTVFYPSVKYCTFELLTKKKKPKNILRPSFGANPPKRGRRCEVHFLVVWWSLISWNLSRKMGSCHRVTKYWQIDSSQYSVTVQGKCWLVTEKKSMLPGWAVLGFLCGWFWFFELGFLVVWWLLAGFFFFFLLLFLMGVFLFVFFVKYLYKRKN